MKVKELIEELSKFNGELKVSFFIQNRENHLKENDVFFCDKMYINTDMKFTALEIIRSKKYITNESGLDFCYR